MQDKADDCMIDPMGECTQAMLNLIIFGVATPYLHNGTIVLGDIEEGKGVSIVLYVNLIFHSCIFCLSSTQNLFSDFQICFESFYR